MRRPRRKLSDAAAAKLQARWRDLSALADNAAASPAESDTARRLADDLAARLRQEGRQTEPEAPPVEAWPGGAAVPARPAVEPVGVPSIQVIDNRTPGRSVQYAVAAAFWCPACDKGRNHGGRCPMCDGRCEPTGRQSPELRR